jgi:multidrug efflux pump subunit AcrB
MFRFNGQPAIGIAIGMKASSNLIEFGKALRAHDGCRGPTADRRRGTWSPTSRRVVAEAIGGFTRALFGAVVIVLV